MNSRKPKTLGDIKCWNRCKVGRYAVYIICGMALVSSIIIFLLRSGCWPQAIPVPEWLDGVIQQKALTAVGSTVGATAIVIAWLINVTGQTVCGERIGILAGWAYPFFFRYYFFVFLLTFFAGIYMGNADTQRLPTLIITAGLGIGAIFIGRVCYVFVIDFKGRERVAYTYYDQQFRYESGMDVNNFKLKCERAIIRITNHTVELEESGEDIPHGTIYALWTVCIENYRTASGDFTPSNGAAAPGNAATQGGLGLNSSCCSLAKLFWDRLIPVSQRTIQHLDFLFYMTYRVQQDLYQVCQESGLLCNLSWDDFVLLMRGHRPAREAAMVVVRETLKEFFRCGHYNFDVTDVEFLRDSDAEGEGSEILHCSSLFLPEEGSSLVESVLFRAEVSQYRRLLDQRKS